MGLCTSYNEVHRIDTAMAEHTINMAGFHCVPIPLSIVSFKLVHGAMDNFDHEENTLSGIDGGHHTNLMVFQNIKYIKLCNEHS